MDLDRDIVLSFSSNLQKASDAIAYSICLAAHLARFSLSQTFDQRLNDGFRALSTGLDLASLSEADTKTELQRCAQAAFSDLNLQFPPLTASVPTTATAPHPEPRAQEARPDEAASAAQQPQTREQANVSVAPPQPPVDPWRTALENALDRIGTVRRPNMEDVVKRAADSWQARLLALLAGVPDQPEVPPDIDYLRCRAANHPLGTVLDGRLRNVTQDKWNEVYVRGMSVSGADIPLPVWFAVAALGMLGFDVPRDLSSSNSPAESADAANFVSKTPTTSARKGLYILRLTADSQTVGWKLNPSIPALILPVDAALRETKIRMVKYLQERLHGILVEVAPNEAYDTVQNRVGIDKLREMFPSVRQGWLFSARPDGKWDVQFSAVKPVDAWEAYTQAFPATATVVKP
jgi:hypothetical protein